MISFYFQTGLNYLPNDSVLYLGVFLFYAENMSALFPVYPEAIAGVKSAGSGSACSLRIFLHGQLNALSALCFDMPFIQSLLLACSGQGRRLPNGFLSAFAHRRPIFRGSSQ